MTPPAPRREGRSVRVLPSPADPQGATQITPEQCPLRSAIYAAEEALRRRGLVRLLPGHGELLMGHPVLGCLFTRAETAARAKDPSVRGRAAVWPDGYELTGEWWAPPWVAGLLRILRPNVATDSPRDRAVELPEVEAVLLLAYRDPEARAAMEVTVRLLRDALSETGEGTTPQEALVAMATGREVPAP